MTNSRQKGQTPIEKFKKWMINHKTEPDRFGQSLKQSIDRVIELYDVDQDYIRAKIKVCKLWLIRNENTGKANKQKWGSFLINFLAPDEVKYGKQRQSAFKGTAGPKRLG